MPMFPLWEHLQNCPFKEKKLKISKITYNSIERSTKVNKVIVFEKK